ECWSRPKVRFAGRDVAAGGGAFQKAVELIDEKRTVLLAYREPDGKLPGEVQEYVAYLQQTLAATKYSTGSVPPVPAKACALCGQSPVVVYPNALKGAGINLANVDRDGAYPGLDVQAAWKSYGLCVGCADLLYVYRHHVARDFLTTVAGEK